MLVLKSIDKTILFLLLVSHLPNRYIGIALIIIFSLKAVSAHKFTFPKEIKDFYYKWLIVIFIGTISFFLHFSSPNNLFWSFFNLAPFVLVPLIIYKKGYNLSSFKLLNTIKVFILIQFIFFFCQYMRFAIELRTINIFAVNSGMGDVLSGTLMGFSSPLTITMSFLSFYLIDIVYIKKQSQHKYYLLLSLLMLFLPGMMSGIMAFFTAFSLSFILIAFKKLLRLKTNKFLLTILIVTSLAFVFLLAFQSDNILYAINIMDLAIDKQAFIKIKIVFQVIDLLKEDPYILLFGVGLGNFASRAAFMVSGEYLSYQPFFIPVTPSEFMDKYVLTIWDKSSNLKIIGGSIGNSMVNEPFLQYVAIAGEFGLIGFLIILFAFLKILFISLKNENLLMLSVLLFTAMIFFTNTWISYPTFAVVFWIALKSSSIKKDT
ncbi:MAG: hypothetical protein OCD01_09525 [Fibrobacterales bacterium]